MQREATVLSPTDDATDIFPPGDAPERVAEGVWRIPLPLPFALRMVNVYLLDDGPGARTLVDAGLGLPTDERALHAGLRRAGIALDDVNTLVLTHAHPDHIGLSGTIQAATGCPIYLLEGEHEALYRVWETDTALHATAEMYVAHGMPAEMLPGADAAARALRKMLRLPPRDAVRPVRDGDRLRLGARDYTVWWTPGHADWHLCLLRDDGVFLAGDHVLPKITPNIGWYPNSRPDPLADYLAALDRVSELPARVVLPGHGLPFADLAGRVAELAAHHAERSDQVRALLGDAQDTGADAYTVALRLFEGRLRSPDDMRFALAETLAHLEHLRLKGLAIRTEPSGADAGPIRYALAQ